MHSFFKLILCVHMCSTSALGPKEVANMKAEEGLVVHDQVWSTEQNSNLFVVGGRNEGFRWNRFVFFHRVFQYGVEDYSWLRPVLNRDVYVSDQVAFGHYSGCGHNVFFQFSPGFYPPTTCPLGDSTRLDAVDIPPQ